MYGAMQAGGDAADHAAGRHPHVERGQVARRRPLRASSPWHTSAQTKNTATWTRDLPTMALTGSKTSTATSADDEDRLQSRPPADAE